MANSETPKVVSNKKHMARLEREQVQRRYIMFGAIAVLILVVGVILYGVLDQTVLKMNRPVAKVGDQVITAREFQARVRYERWRSIQQYTQAAQIAQFFASDPNMGQYYQQQVQQMASQINDTTSFAQSVLDEMINDKVIEREAANRGITITDADVDKALEEGFNYFPNGTPTSQPLPPTAIPTSTLSPLQLTLYPPTATPTEAPTATPEATTPTVAPTAEPTSATPEATGTPAPTATPYTEAGYKQAVSDFLSAVKTYNFTESDLRSYVRAQVLRNKLYDEVTKDMKPEEEQVWARHILVADEAAAQVIVKQLKDGADFAELAKKLSTDTGSKESGGDLGWFSKGKMVKEFEDAAFALEVGQISDPVKSKFGYHIIQVLGHENRPLDEQAFSDLKQTTFTDFVAKLKETDDVKTYDTWTSFVPTEPSLSGSGLQ